MTNTIEIKSTLLRMSELLYDGDQAFWGNILSKILLDIDNGSIDTKARIQNLFGGMGSLNDVALYKNGHIMREEGLELMTLSEKLFDLTK